MRVSARLMSMQLTQPSKQLQISAFLSERITAGEFPSAVYGVYENGKHMFADALGHAVVDPYGIEASINTVYDLASLTKPLITTLLLVRRVEQLGINLADSVSSYLTEFRDSDKSDISVLQLLTHTSGLEAWRPLYLLCEGDPARAIEQILKQPLEAETGSRVIYSDLGFIVLGILLERVTGKSIAELAPEEIFRPLNLTHSFFRPEISRQTGIAACERGNLYERNSCRELGFPEYTESRRRTIWGEVHDGNAYFLGGAAGHAGLFSTAAETLQIARQFLASETTLLRPESCELFSTNLTPGLEEARSVGWQLATTSDSTAGTTLPPTSFGHNGFTGTSCWVDPVHQRIFVLLTNRTHARALPFANINATRREFHRLAVAALENH